MVSFRNLEDGYAYVEQSISSDDQSKCALSENLLDFKTHLYLLGSTAKSNDPHQGLLCDGEGEQSLLDSLLLAQWEECAWKNQLSYDVTLCETKVIDGNMKFIAQLNENWNPNSLTEFENKMLQPFRSWKSSHMKKFGDDILFCIANGVKENSELVLSRALPREGALVIINENPVEYGHVFLVPYCIHQRLGYPYMKAFEAILRIAVETNNCSFRISCDQTASPSTTDMYFQANYFAHPLPVELLPTIPLHGGSIRKGMHLSEVAGYPLKVLVIKSNDRELLAEAMTDICCSLDDQSIAVNLLVSGSGTKIYLFPQVKSKVVSSYLLSTWECGGYFIYNARSRFESISDEEISRYLNYVSLEEKEFEALKQLCCSVADKLSTYTGNRACHVSASKRLGDYEGQG